MEAWALLGEDRGGLHEVMRQAENLGEELFSLNPISFKDLGWAAREDLAFYLRRLGGLDENDSWRAWRETGVLSLAEAFPDAVGRMRNSVVKARETIVGLEASLGLQWKGSLLSRLESERIRLELQIRQGAIREAAARATGRTAFAIRDAVVWNARQDPEPEWRQERAALLVAISGAWELPSTPVDLEQLAKIIGERSGKPAVESLVEMGAFLRRLESVEPSHLAGVRRQLVRKVHRNRTLRLAQNLSYEAVDRLARSPQNHPGLYVMENPRRTYPAGVAPHIVGLVRSANEEDLSEWLDLREEFSGLARLLRRTPEQESRWLDLRSRLWREVLRPGETRGRSGVERAWEPLLRGQRGFLQVLDGEQKEGDLLELDLAPPRHGQDVALSLDAELQKAAQVAVVKAYGIAERRLEEGGVSVGGL
ncbi:MAG TPA: hypothetical protein DDW23_02455, partial [Planctomycetes bacterium]|nr:hypothetical protein [Planctomycetota bacterium]